MNYHPVAISNGGRQSAVFALETAVTGAIKE
jgi:hypothetical protein